MKRRVMLKTPFLVLQFLKSNWKKGNLMFFLNVVLWLSYSFCLIRPSFPKLRFWERVCDINREKYLPLSVFPNFKNYLNFNFYSKLDLYQILKNLKELNF